MHRQLALLLAFFVAASTTACRATPITPTVDSMIGHYSWGESFSTSIGGGYRSVSLELLADGTFRSSSWGNWGMSAVRLEDFADAGSTGEWSVEGNEICFVVDQEPSGVFVSFDGSTARPTNDGLCLRSAGKRLEFVRFDPRTVSPGVPGGEYEADLAILGYGPADSSVRAEPRDYVPVDRCLLTSLTLHESHSTLTWSGGGTFIAGVWPYSVDGCLTVVGNGIARGSYTREGGVVRFVVEEQSPDLAFDIDGATARRDDGDWVLRAKDGAEYRFTPGRNHSTELSAH